MTLHTAFLYLEYAFSHKDVYVEPLWLHFYISLKTVM